MTDITFDSRKTPSFGTYTLITGILLIILGMAGIILPNLLALGTALFLGWLLFSAGLIWAFHTFRYNPKSFSDWLKPFFLLLCGSFILFYPLSGIEMVGLLLAVYLMVDAFGSFALARTIYPVKGWGWMTFNGTTSLILALLFLIGGAATSMLLIGIFIGISLFFDGFVLTAIGWKTKKKEKGE